MSEEKTAAAALATMNHALYHEAARRANSWMNLVLQFNERFGVVEADVDEVLEKGMGFGHVSPEVIALGRRLVEEEHAELMKGLDERDILAVTDGIVDSIYVLIGLATRLGIPMNHMFFEAHCSNLTKLGSDGKPILRDDGKVMKSEYFHPPKFDLVFEQFVSSMRY